MKRKKFNKFLYYSLLFVGIGVDIALDICYSFTFLVMVFGEFFLLEKDNCKDLSKLFIILMIGIGPFIMGMFLTFIKNIS